MDHHPRPAWQLRALRWSIGTLATLLVLACISWLALPPLVKHIAIEQTQEKIGRKLSLGKISFNPFRLALTLNDVVLYEPDQTTPALRAQQLLLNLSSTSLLHLSAVLDEVKLVAPDLHLVRLSDTGLGNYNFSDIIERIQAMPKSEGTTYFSLANIQLQNGTILIDDKVSGKTIDVRSLNLGVPSISNLPRNVDTFVQPQLSMTVNGTPFSLKGRSKPFASSLETTLAIDIDKLDIASYLPFVPLALPVKLQSATLSSTMDLTFSRDQQQPQIALAGSLTLADVAIQEKSNNDLLKIKSITARIGKLDLFKSSGVIDQISIDKPQLWASLNKQGEINWARISNEGNKRNAQASDNKLATSATTAPNSTKTAAITPAISIDKLTMRDGSLNWSDDANALPRQLVQLVQLENISIDAENISTLADAKPAKVELSLTENQQGNVSFNGEIAPLKASVLGRVTLKGVQMKGYQNYLNRALNGTLNGQLSGQTSLQLADGNLKLDKLSLAINNLRLAAKPGSAKQTDKTANGIISARTIAVENAALDLRAHSASAETFRLIGLDGDLRRDANGRLNLQDLLLTNSATDTPAAETKKPSPAASAPTTSMASPWQARLRNLALSDSGLSYEDNTVSPAQKLRIDGLDLKLDKLSTQFDQSSAISLQAIVNKSGKLSINGQASAQLKSVNLNLDAQNLPLAPFQSYFTDYLNVTLSNGTLSTKGKLALTPPLNKQVLALQYNGAASLNNFRLQDKLSSADFLRWRTLNLQGIDASIGTRPLISLEKIALSDFYARAILSEQGKLNLQNIVVRKDQPPTSVVAAPAADNSSAASTSAPPPSATPPAADPNAPVIRIGQTVLESGNINYTDNFVKPNYTANMTNMSGTIGSIASDRNDAATLDLHGKIDNDAPLQISGTLNPLFKPMFLDIKGSANGIQLPRLTPYSTKYAGYPITKGKLSTDVQYRIEDGKLVAQNDVRIEQLTFGDHVDGPSATKLPVMLAISLLKDRDGTINLNLPISGSLSDPQFSIGGILMRVFTNLIIKAVTSPFALISSMFGSGDTGELSYIEFAPGSAELNADIRKKLDTLGYALHQRPALKIDVMGRVDPVLDESGLREELLNQKMRALKRKDVIARQGQPTADDIQLSESERSKYLEKVYSNETFKKPRNVIGLTQSIPPAEMQKLIIDNTKINEDDLRDLAQRRADLVRNYLQDQSIIAAERIFLIAPKLNTDGIKDKGSGSRVDLTLQQ